MDLRPYLAAFSARFQALLQYRAAAAAGFVTQLWWGGIKIMIYAAFWNAGGAAAAPMPLAHVITYTWLAQGLLLLTPWQGDPEVAAAVRTGGVGYDRLRPLDTYAWWYARACAWISARIAPRLALMVLAAGVILPLIGLGDWSLRPPPGAGEALLFMVSLGLALLLSAAIVVVLNVVMVALLNERGINALAMPVTNVLSGSLLPLALYPDALQMALLIQPFAGLLDIPMRIYTGQMAGEAALVGLGLQAFWTLVFVLAGRAWLDRRMLRLQMQGG